MADEKPKYKNDSLDEKQRYKSKDFDEKQRYILNV
jgi:hypothetical protein